MPSNIFTRFLQKRFIVLAFGFALLAMPSYALAWIDAGGPYMMNDFNNLQLSGNTDWGALSTTAWSKVSGPGTVTFSPSFGSKTPNISVSQAGAYVVQYCNPDICDSANLTVVNISSSAGTVYVDPGQTVSASISVNPTPDPMTVQFSYMENIPNVTLGSPPTTRSCNPSCTVNLSVTASASASPDSYSFTFLAGEANTLADYGHGDTITVVVNNPAPPAPSTPTGLTVTPQCSGTSSRIQLDWADTAGADEYEVSRCANAGCSPSYYATALGSSYLNTSVTAGTLYRYRVRACNAGGCSSNTSIAEATALNCSAPPPPPPSCNPRTFRQPPSGFYNTAGASITSIARNTPFDILCDYTVATDDTGIIPVTVGAPNCGWIDFVGTSARFRCDSGIATAGTYTYECKVGGNTPPATANSCYQNNPIGSITVTGGGTPPPPPPVGPPPPPPPPPPSLGCSGVTVSAANVYGPTATYDVIISGVTGAADVRVPHWAELNGQNDIGGWPWSAATNQGGGTWRFTVQLNHHMTGTPEYGRVINHVYLNGSDYFCGEAIVQWAASAAPSNNIVGSHDVADCNMIQGWSCDQDVPYSGNTVELYMGGPKGTGTLIGTGVANQARESAVGSACNGDPANVNHGFSITTPNAAKTGSAQNIYAYALNIGGAGETLLSSSPRSVNCPVPPPPPPPPSPLANNAQCVAFGAPTTVEAGTSFWTTVVMKNTGTKTWAQLTDHKLGANDSSWSPLLVNLPVSSVPTNANAEFGFSVTAPSGTTGPGTYPNHGWKMLEGSVGFGEACIQSITVTPTPAIPSITDASCSTSWGPDIAIGGNPAVGWNPSMVSLPFGDERLVLAMMGSDGYVYVAEWENALLKDWYRVNNGQTNARPKLVREGSDIWLYIRGLDNYIHKTRYVSEGVWESWIHTSLACSSPSCANMGGWCNGTCEVATSWGTWRASVVATGYEKLQKCAQILIPPPPPPPQPIYFDLHGYGWSPNVGWLSMNCEDRGGSVCATTNNYKVKVDSSTGYLVGDAWSSTVGWVKFNPINTDRAPEAPYAPARLVNNQITGWARACGGTYYKDCISATRTDGWDGWIKLSPETSEPQDAYAHYGLTKVISGGVQRIVGFAWGGGDMFGWLKFCDPDRPAGHVLSCLNTGQPPVTIDTEPPQISNIKVDDIDTPTTLPIGTINADLSFDTNMNATCRFSDTAGTAYDDMTNTFDSSDGLRHTFDISGLENGESYTYFVRCINEFGDVSSEETINFSIDEPPPPPNFTYRHTPYWPSEGVHDAHKNPDMVMGNSDISSPVTLRFEGIEGLQNGQVTVVVESLFEDRLPYNSESDYGDGNARNENELSLTKITPVFDGTNRLSRQVNIVNGVGQTVFKVRKRNIGSGRYIVNLRYSLPGVEDKTDALVFIIGRDTPGYIEL